MEDRRRRLERAALAGGPEASDRAARESCRAEGHAWVFAASLEATNRLPGRIWVEVCSRCPETRSTWDRPPDVKRCESCGSPIAVREHKDRATCRSCLVESADASGSLCEFHLVRLNGSGRGVNHASASEFNLTVCGSPTEGWRSVFRPSTPTCSVCAEVISAERRRRDERDHRFGDPWWSSPVHLESDAEPGVALCGEDEPDPERFYSFEAVVSGSLTPRVRPCRGCWVAGVSRLR